MLDLTTFFIYNFSKSFHSIKVYGAQMVHVEKDKSMTATKILEIFSDYV